MNDKEEKIFIKDEELFFIIDKYFKNKMKEAQE
jgi:hypothetical protein